MEHLLIAHRGDTASYPENTIEAFASALDKGAAGFELDTQERDDTMIVVHNYLYDKTKDYVTLDEVLREFAGKGRLEIELKSLDVGFLEPLEKSLQPYVGADIELTTSVIGIINHVRPKFKHFPLGVIFQDREFEDWMTEDDFITTKITKLMQLYQGDIAHIPRRVVHPELIDALHQLGMRAHVHLPAGPMPEQLDNYRRLRALSVDQSTFDDMELLRHIEGYEMKTPRSGGRP